MNYFGDALQEELQPQPQPWLSTWVSHLSCMAPYMSPPCFSALVPFFLSARWWPFFPEALQAHDLLIPHKCCPVNINNTTANGLHNWLPVHTRSSSVSSIPWQTYTGKPGRCLSKTQQASKKTAMTQQGLGNFNKRRVYYFFFFYVKTDGIQP